MNRTVHTSLWWICLGLFATLLVAVPLFGSNVIGTYLDATADSVAATAPATVPSQTPSPTSTPQPSPEPVPEPEPALPDEAVGSEAIDNAAARARELLGMVRILPERENVPGYDRDCGPGDGCVFGTSWTDDTDAPSSRNGCDTRNDVLGTSLDGVEFSASSPGCDVVAGTLQDPYTGTTMDYATEGAQIHVDHLFPLAAAWDLGAAQWSPDERASFANDTDLELLAVNGTENLRKSDSTPASWLPPNKAYRCAYVTAYLEVALAYGLGITAADVRVIEPVLRKSC